jgi:D-3-phosphoglycerate dehydrogenase
VIDVEACTKAGILVCNQSGANKEAVAEHAVGLMLAISKKIMETDRAMRKTDNIERFRYVGTELLGKTIGIVGLGNIGSRVAEICKAAFRMTVLAYDPYLSTEKIAARHAEKVELKELLQRADYVTLHCPRTKETFDMIGYDELCLMKPTAFFINTSRAAPTRRPTSPARCRSARSPAPASTFPRRAAADDPPLMAFDNVILTPHNAGSTREAHANVATYASDQWIDIFDGKVPPRLINRDAWPRYSERFQKISASSQSRWARSDRRSPNRLVSCGESRLVCRDSPGPTHDSPRSLARPPEAALRRGRGGSGYGGGVTASRLARAGKRVAVLERGREFVTGDSPPASPTCAARCS